MHIVTGTFAAAALLTAGGIGGAALTASPAVAPPARPARAAPVEVRTEVIHRTVHVVRHVRPKHAAAPPPARAPAVVPVRPQPIAAAAAPAPRRTARPLQTRSSATGGASGEHDDRGEHEGGGENEGGGDD